MPTLRYLTAGESHGKGLVGILEGMPAGVPLSLDDFATLLRRRWGGFGRSPRRSIEPEKIEILSGVRFGKTLGTPIALFLPNADHANWKEIMAAAGPRPATVRSLSQIAPGHADLSGAWKYDVEDLRDIRERASARETAMRAALSVPARNLLTALGVRSVAMVSELGGHPAIIPSDQTVEELQAAVARVGDAFLTPDRSATYAWRTMIENLRRGKNTLGGCAEIRFDGLPIGLGSHVHYDRRLDGRLAMVLMSIPSVRGVEIGSGIAQSRLPGSEAHDSLTTLTDLQCRASNLAGGLEGGMTNGQPLSIRVFIKPPPSVSGLDSIDWISGKAVKTSPERTDTVAVAAVAIIAESVIAIELASALLETYGGDTFSDLRDNLENAAGKRLKKMPGTSKTTASGKKRTSGPRRA